MAIKSKFGLESALDGGNHFLFLGKVCAGRQVTEKIRENQRQEKQMNLMKITRLLWVGVFIFILIGCGGKYDDMVEVNSDFIDAMEEYVAGMDEASSAKEMAAVINRYAEKVKTLAPKIKDLRNKYPELNESEEVPDELRALDKKAEALQQKMTAGFANMMKYMMDADVQAAHQKLQNAMAEMK